MGNYLNSNFDFENAELVNVLDELPLWSAPFGLKLLEMVDYKKNLTVLDIGFGLGFPLTELAMRLGDSSKVYGIDLWEMAIERAKSKLGIYEISNTTILNASADEMPFKNSFFDLIVSNNGLNNVNDLKKSFYECGRVAKKSAQFVFTMNLENSMIEFYEIYKEVLIENALIPELTNLKEHIYHKRRPLSEIRKELTDNKFFIRNELHDTFSYCFADGTSMLNHFLIRLAFLDSWKQNPDRSIKINGNF